MIIDGNTDPREKMIVEDIVNIINLTPSERVASRSVPRDTQVRILKNMDTLKKCYVAKFLAQVALADGCVTREENYFFNYCTQILGLPNDPDEL